MNVNIGGREYKDYSFNIPSEDYKMVLLDYSKYATIYYVKIDISDHASSSSIVEKLQNWNNMATHSLHHKIDEVRKLLKSVEDTTKRAKALLDQFI